MSNSSLQQAIWFLADVSIYTCHKSSSLARLTGEYEGCPKHLDSPPLYLFQGAISASGLDCLGSTSWYFKMRLWLYLFSPLSSGFSFHWQHYSRSIWVKNMDRNISSDLVLLWCFSKTLKHKGKALHRFSSTSRLIRPSFPVSEVRTMGIVVWHIWQMLKWGRLPYTVLMKMPPYHQNSWHLYLL